MRKPKSKAKAPGSERPTRQYFSPSQNAWFVRIPANSEASVKVSEFDQDGKRLSGTAFAAAIAHGRELAIKKVDDLRRG